MNRKGNKNRLQVFLFILFFGFFSVFLWIRYLSPEAREIRTTQKSYTQAVQGLKTFEDIRKNDVIGGKTPEETLNLFTKAIQDENIEHAARYFVFINKQEKKEMEEIFTKLKVEKKLPILATALSHVEPYIKDQLHSNDYKFVKYNETRTAFELYIDMEFNSHANVWKIESL